VNGRTILGRRKATNQAGSPETPRAPYPHRDFPALTADHFNDARLYADRRDLVEGLGLSTGGAAAEVGVAQGDFSQELLRILQPSLFVAIDLFTMHEQPMHWGRSSQEIFEGLSHAEYYARRFAAFGGVVQVREGRSDEVLETFPDQFFDLIYLDADHRFESIEKDASIATRKLKPSGTLVFNDYVMYDHLLNEPYGIVPVVNRLVVEGGWEVVGFALQQHMFCDIALRRKWADS
jgi:hypothetical protein